MGSREVTPDYHQGHLIVGRAWESSEEEGVKLVNAQVGLSDNASIALALQAEIQQQEETIEALRAQNKLLEERLLRLEAIIAGSPQ